MRSIKLSIGIVQPPSLVSFVELAPVDGKEKPQANGEVHRYVPGKITRFRIQAKADSSQAN